MKARKKKIIYIILGSVIFVLSAYIAISLFFINHFFMNTKINGYDFSGKTLSEAESFFRERIEGYTLTINGFDIQKDLIRGEEISLAYKEGDEIENILKKQTPLLWPKSVFSGSVYDIAIDLSYDDEQLDQKIASLNILNIEQTPSVSAYPRYESDQFIIQEEIYGTEIDMELLKEAVVSAIIQLTPEINLKREEHCVLPKYLSDSKEVKQACAEMNNYCQTSITYSMDVPVVIDGSVISTWLSVDEEMNVMLDQDAIKKWLEEFGDVYDTLGSTRTFTTPAGKETSVSGGTYGWSINEEAEFITIMEALKDKQTIIKEPEYYIGGTAAVHAMPDWGDTYAEVDLSEQYMWYISQGEILLETDVVTGEPIPEKITPEGVYTILEKEVNTILIGEKNPVTGEPEYETRVDYWMRVTWEGVGFHDADWQEAFGGSLNQIEGVGSHGCINMPSYKAAEFYNMVEEGTPVVIHY